MMVEPAIIAVQAYLSFPVYCMDRRLNWLCRCYCCHLSESPSAVVHGACSQEQCD